MASRVEKYYSELDDATKRSQKNQDLYDAISEFDKETEDDLAKLHQLFDNYENRNVITSQDVSYDTLPSRNQLYRSIYEDLEDSYDTLDVYDTKEDDSKIKQLVDTITEQLDFLEAQESYLENLKDLTSPKEEEKTNIIKEKKREISDLFQKDKPFVFSKKNLSHLLKDEKEEEKALNLKIKKIVGIAFLINSIFLLVYLYFSIR